MTSKTYTRTAHITVLDHESSLEVHELDDCTVFTGELTGRSDAHPKTSLTVATFKADGDTHLVMTANDQSVFAIMTREQREHLRTFLNNMHNDELAALTKD